ncbi:coumarin 8-geranyltransferase 1, chloroplastic-like [Citrus sinensis]|uniref:coumarin 8-geranyltransferase 1, chloroplastic-like n=1 Tax=Citrus sinensis TaxID=2711 RepID=UPI0022780A51|nr:coumarin 8-geranyltransferase 1, chloroplastic-like [Citrus sinensis]
MLLQMNLCSSFSLKYHPLQQNGTVKTFQSPLTQIYGLANRRESNKYSVKGSIQSSFCLTNNKIGNNEDMMNRYHKPLKKSTVPMALQDDSATKSQNENIVSTSFLDFLTKKLDAFYRLSRPYAWTSIIVGILSSSLLPIQSLADLTPTFLIEVLKPIVPTIMMNIFVVAINQLSDIAIDKSLAMGVMLRSPPLVIALILRCILGAAYSIHLPLLRWKASPLMAAVAIVIGNGINNVLPSFLHVQKYVLGRPVVFTKPLLFAVAFSAIFSIVLSLLKDIPDVEGDKKSGIRTLPVILGKERVLSMSTGILLMAYASAALAGVFSPILLCKLVTMIGHSVLGFILWK